jgi:chitinase
MEWIWTGNTPVLVRSPHLISQPLSYGCWQKEDDRGGRPEDSANYVLLSKDIKAAFGSKYGYSITLPASYWYLQHFDLAGHQPHVDWFNIMSYDLHGVWDAASKFIGPYLATHTNITEIDLGMELLWRAGVKPEKVTLGQGCKGDSYSFESQHN